MRVVFIPDVPEYGGAYNSFCEMVETLAENHSVEPIILTAKNGKYLEFAQSKGYESYVINYKPFYLQKGNTIEIRLVKFLLLPYLYCRYVLVGYMAIKSIERVIDFNCIDIIHSNVNRDDIGAILSGRHGVPHVWHLREPSEKNRYYSFRHNFISFMNQNTDAFIAISDMVKSEWEKSGIEGEKIHRVYNGIDVKRFYANRTNDVGNIIRIIMIGRLAVHKGQIILLRAIAMLPKEYREQIHVDFYGNSEMGYKRRLERYIKHEGIEEAISFCAYDTSIEKALSRYDVGMMCSNNEGFGRATIEYMLSGLCVIASNSGANPELVDDGVSGFLFKNNDAADLARVITNICNNKRQIRTIGKLAQQIAAKRFSREQNANSVYELYENLINEKRKL
ncbi:glycosyltransferase family 4 protein [Butyrivibrio sp. AE3006]|uniref:glycosyltransferase family 4 protein n=1 Tax=Butyrivibrio sp. AE3006 TaxID=1280673 RepID=UPI0003F75371|nr:glycosyltransferase family 4 protein [Butyrivibrio sp. AE3006]